MSTAALDSLIHDPGRLRVVAILAAQPDGDALTVTRLQNMIATPPCCANCPGQPGRIISYQHPPCARAMQTGTRLPRLWVSTSCKAG